MWLHAKVLLWRGWLPGLRVDQLVLLWAVAAGVGHLALRWTNDGRTSAAAACLFVAAPGHLRWMATVFGSNGLVPALASVWCVVWTYDGVRGGRGGAYLAAAIAAVVGLLSYEQTAVVPLLAVLLAWMAGAGSWRRCLAPAAGAVALTVAYFALRFALFGGLGGYRTVEGEEWIASGSLFGVLAQVWQTEGAIAQSLAWPVQPPLADMPAWFNRAAVALWLALGVLAWRRRRDLGRPLAAALAWIVVVALPVIGTMRVPHAWHAYSFFGSMGAAIFAALVLEALLAGRARTVATAALVAVLVGTTWAGLRMWFDTWAQARAFVTQLRAAVPPDQTPAMVYVEHLPGPAGAGHLLFNAPTDHEAYTGYLPDRVFLRHMPVQWPYSFPYSGDRAWPPPDALRFRWFAWDAAARRLEPVADMPAPVPGVPATWDLRAAAAARAWRPETQLERVPRSRPPAYVTLGKLALLGGPPLPATLGTPVYADLTMRVQTEDGEPGIAEWHFCTADAPELSPQHVVRFWVEQDGKPQTYRVPLVNNPQLLLDGPPTRIDLRPTTSPRAVVQIARIAFVPRPAEAHD